MSTTHRSKSTGQHGKGARAVRPAIATATNSTISRNAGTLSLLPMDAHTISRGPARLLDTLIAHGQARLVPPRAVPFLSWHPGQHPQQEKQAAAKAMAAELATR